MRFRFSIVALAALLAAAAGIAAWTGGIAAPRSGPLLADKRPMNNDDDLKKYLKKFEELAKTEAEAPSAGAASPSA